jgi:chemotaxis protein MotB
LARLAAGSDGPSFYLSLSDLMSLLLVFFVLIFSLTGGEDTRPAVGRGSAFTPPQAASVRAGADALLALPAPPPKSVTRALKAVAAAGRPDPELVAQAKPKPAAPKPAPPSRRIAISPSLLTLVTTSRPLPPSALPQEETRLSRLLAQLDQAVAGGTTGVEMERRVREVVLRLPEAVTFDQGQAELKPGMQKVLARVAAVLTKHPDYRIVVTGHTDDLPIHNQRFASNWELSAARAAAVARALIQKGLDPRRFTIRGLADQKPRVPNDSPLHRRMNRRVEIVLKAG